MTGTVVAEKTCDAGMTDLAGQAGCAISGAAQGTLETMFNWLVGGAAWAVKWTGVAWLSFPEPTIGTKDGTPSETISQIWSLGGFYIMGIAVVSLLVGAVRLMWTPNRQTGMALLRGLAAIITVQSAGIAVTALLLDAGNQFSTWIVMRASGKEFETALADFSGLGGVTKTLGAEGALLGLGPVIAFAALGFLVLLIGAFAQVCLLIVRSVLIVVIWAFLPFLASAAFTDGGSKALSRAVGWLFSLVLYKPVAGIIYSIGVLLLKNAAKDASAEEQMMNLLIAVVTVGFAALALPALVRFVAPQAAIGASMAFSGGAMAASAVGTGAAVVALGGTGGGSAAAGAGAAGAGAGSGAADAEGAGTTGGGGTAGGGGGGGSKGGPQGASGTGGGGTDSGASSSGDESATVTSDGASTDTGSSSSGASSGGSQTSGGQGASGGSSGSSSAGGSSDEGDDSDGSAADGAETTSTGGGSPASGTSSSESSESSSGGDSAADGADQAAAPAPGPGPQGASPAGGAGRSGQVAGAVRDAARETKSSADGVDFNEGQGES